MRRSSQSEGRTPSKYLLGLSIIILSMTVSGTPDSISLGITARLSQRYPSGFCSLLGMPGEPMRDSVRYTFIRCEANPNPLFQAMGDKVKGDDRWAYVGLDTHHDAMLLAPDALTEALLAA